VTLGEQIRSRQPPMEKPELGPSQKTKPSTNKNNKIVKNYGLGALPIVQTVLSVRFESPMHNKKYDDSVIFFVKYLKKIFLH
jgi:hypothetical protein